jgi:hypothetical protein
MAVNDDARELGGILGEIRQAMQEVDDSFKRGSNSLQSVVDIASQYNDYQNNTIKLNSKQLEQLSKKLKIEKSRLQSSQQSLQNSIAEKENQKQLLQSRISLLGEEHALVASLQKEYDKITNTLHEQETLFSQINDVLNDTNNQIDEIEEGLDRAASNEKFSERFEVLNQQAEKFGKTLGISLTFSGLLSILKETDKALGDFSKSMNMTYSDSTKLKKEYEGIAEALGDNSLNSTRLLETQAAIGEALGTNAKINEADLKTFTKLRIQAGYTNEELMGIQQLSLLNGKSLEKNTSEILGGAKAYAARNKIVVNEKQVLKEVSKASAALKLSLGGSTKEIAEAVVKAKQFGLTLEQTEKMSQSLLNFEESIESELSAELLTGKDLNLERARGLALNGQTADAAAEIAAQVGSSAEFGKMSVIQQEAIAKAVGMERNELAQSLIDREALANIGFKDAEAAKAKYDLLRQTMTAEEAAAALGDEDLARQYEQQSIQEKFNDSMEQLKIMLSDSLLPGFEKMGKFLTENMGIIKTIVGSFLILKAAQVTYNALSAVSLAIQKKRKTESTKEAIANIIGGAFKSMGTLPVVGAIMAGVLAATAIGSLFSDIGKVEDGVIDPQGGLLVSGKKGSIQLHKDDSIITGTDLIGNNKQTSKGGSGGSGMAAALNSITEMKNSINALATRPVNMYMDNRKVAEALYNDPNSMGDASRTKAWKIN